MSGENSNHGRKFGADRRGVGIGRQPQQIQRFVPVKFNNFQGGLDLRDAPQDIAANSSQDALDMEVNKRDYLVKAPGTEEFMALDPKSPFQIALHVGLSFKGELLLIDPPEIGVQDENPLRWINTTMYAGTVDPFFWATFGDAWVFANGSGIVRSKIAGTDEITDQPLIPNGATFCVSAARLFVGGAVIDGVRQPMVVAWSGYLGFDKFDFVTDLGSGFEPLIGDQSSGDEIVAMRAMGLDLVAILCRRSVWIGRRTGDLDRPLDFQPRVVGKGAAVEACAKSVYGGVIYLGLNGVEFFDGNDAKHISDQIDMDLLPIDFDNLAKYSAAYHPTLQLYYLFTPSCTYVLDILKGRWYKRSLIALGGIPFAERMAGVTWAAINGSWDDQLDTWSGMSGDEATIPIMTFLGVDNDFKTSVHQESYPSYENFGLPFTPRWATPFAEGQYADQVATTNSVKVRYQSGGEVDLWLPDIDQDWDKVNVDPIVLADASKLHLENLRIMWTGMGAGWKFEYLSGTPEISMVELAVQPRGPRLRNGLPFAARDLQPDF